MHSMGSVSFPEATVQWEEMETSSCCVKLASGCECQTAEYVRLLSRLPSRSPWSVVFVLFIMSSHLHC